ncbi:outer envelope pore protein 16-2, chloroplastic-like isoform X4 [Juglans microcarpa x Juglans regia]|uniref:outer envelope pore protein 16-2, chloroplastic-like isoform X4 n=1 Tax=Juglans microcarpa x Juglans regia TaxID=2249226 RepID=UPI001B7E5A37|nr:outer envelope pore protein 16-2, chloroplastic-like isoform X4 [Juglans microcarpa x Juglans regia]
MSNSRKMETSSSTRSLNLLDNGGFFDLGHPLLNRIADSFFKASGIGAIQAVSRQAYFTAIEGETNRKSLEAMVVNARKESLQWGSVFRSHLRAKGGLRSSCMIGKIVQ